MTAQRQPGGVIERCSFALLGAVMLAGCSSKQDPIVVAGPPATGTASRTEQTAAAADDEKQIRSLFGRYWEHLAKKEGDKAVACLDKPSVDWYEAIRLDALEMKKEDLNKQNLHRRLTIVQFRNEFDRDTLTRSTGPVLLARGLTRGWLESAAQTKVVLGYVGSNGKSAHALLAANADGPAFMFEKEADGWKINETRLHEMAQLKLAGLVPKGLDENTFLTNFLTEISGRKVDPRTFDGPLAKVPG